MRGVALVAVLAIASSALLPLAHSATGHLSECAVCSVFAHNAASVGDVAAHQEVSPLAAVGAVEAFAPVALLTSNALDSSEARAPPFISVSI